MLRELIAWVLNNYLGKYVENLNTAQLTIALLSGEVELENLPLRRDCLRHLGLPLQALCGSIGKIKLQVPVRSFRSAPWCINIEKIYVVCGPVNLDEWNTATEQQANLDYKLSSLDRLEARWRAKCESSTMESSNNYYASSYSGWMNYGTSLVTNIIENLQLKINDVHIRYEDTITIPNFNFACGITIETLSAQSCDSNWLPGFTQNWQQNQSTFKLVELQSFCMYWDPLKPNEKFGDLQSSELAEGLLQYKLSNTKQSHEYIISPVSAQAHLKRDRSETPLRTRSRPRLVCDLVWNEISLSLSDCQYNQMVGCIRGLDDIAKCRRYRLLRPQHTITEQPRAWWLYAARCHNLLKNHKYDKGSSVNLVKNNLKYISLYSRIIINPNDMLSNEEKDFKDTVERERGYEELRNLREISMYQTTSTITENAIKNEKNQGRSMLLQWFPQWWGWYQTPASDPQQSPQTKEEPEIKIKQSDTTNSNQLEDELLNALSDTVENNSLLKRDAVFGKFDFKLKKGILDICCCGQDRTIIPMLQLQFENLLLNIESRPRSGSHFVNLSLGSVFIKDRITNNSEFPDLIKPQTKEDNIPTGVASTKSSRTGIRSALSSNSINSATSSKTSRSQQSNSSRPNEPLFQMQYERKPLSYNTDYRLMIKSQSLDIVYNTGALNWLIDFISKPHQVAATKRHIEAMKNKTKKELMKNWENMMEGHLSERKTWTLEIDIFAPQIIFVENFSQKHNSSIVVVDFGRLQLTNGYAQRHQQQMQQQQQQQQQQEQKNQQQQEQKLSFDMLHRDSEDEDAFMTPCSTPPGSHASATDSPTLVSAISDIPELGNVNVDGLDENALYNKLYDSYNLDLTDLQVLVCKGKERWGFASAKGTSTLHVLDRFNISLQVDRRIVYTADPQYPSLTLSGILPKLNAHVNEQKIIALTNLYNIIMAKNNVESPFQSPSNDQLHFINGTGASEANEPAADLSADLVPDADVTPEQILNEENANTASEETEDMSQREISKLIILQFAIDQMSLEVQSVGRSIAELQVTGVKAGFTKLTDDTNLTLSVHGLLLVDAMQSYGQDFELLIASHRHVGMDSVSGSLRQSEPCSPCSPGSPDPNAEILRRPTSPLSISKALTNLQRANSPLWNAADTISNFGDLDALITFEMLFMNDGPEKLQIANIQFNNLDIIANQETIVELIGFAKRVFPEQTKQSKLSKATEPQPCGETPMNANVADANAVEKDVVHRTEITFDFHRLNVLILRALMRDNYMVGRKVGTFTMSEAKIHATLGKVTRVEGSLGGLQILDLTPEGVNHQRILSVGKDPLTDPPTVIPDLLQSLTEEIYGNGNNSGSNKDMDGRQALSFKISRNLNACVDIKVRMASVWFIHCARFMQELSWCASEFKHYFKNLLGQIREKATDMALGLVQTPSVQLSNANPRTSDNVNSPRHTKTATRHRTISFSNKVQQPAALNSPVNKIEFKLDVVLDTPVLVLPRSSVSHQVLVAHLGKISINNSMNENKLTSEHLNSREQSKIDPQFHTHFTINKNDDLYNIIGDDFVNDANEIFEFDNEEELASSETPPELDNTDTDDNLDTYVIDIRNMNLFSLDTTNRKGFRLSALPRAEDFYSCQEDAITIVHDTAIQLKIKYNPLEVSPDANFDKNILDINGSVIKPLRLSLTKRQYEQLLETIDNLFRVPDDLVRPPTDDGISKQHLIKNINSEDTDSFVMDSKFKKNLFQQNNINEKLVVLLPKVSFALPSFIIELNNDKNDPLIEISFREFNVNYEKKNLYEISIEISLRSLFMEDLLRPENSKHRIMVVSSSQDDQNMRSQNFSSSHSCPNLMNLLMNDENISSSLPNNLYYPPGLMLMPKKKMCPDTPPPSPQPQKGQQETLVIYNSLLVDPNAPDFETRYHSLRQSSAIDFNSLDLVISVQSWLVLLNFFGLLSDDGASENNSSQSVSEPQVKQEAAGNSKLMISVRSLTLVLVKPDYELAKANVSNAYFVVSKYGESKTVDGRLGSISLSDLTEHGAIYRERFMTSGNEALSFCYLRDAARTNEFSLKTDAKLKIQMSSVRYVHTKRFVIEIQTFFKDFSQLQTSVMRKIKPSESRQKLQQRPTQLGLEINAASPIILLPLCSSSDKLIVADLGEFTLKNKFVMSGNPKETISIKSDANGPNEILDVMLVHLKHTDLFAGYRHVKTDNGTLDADIVSGIDMGNYVLMKKGSSLLKDKCHLKLQVERNMDTWKSHNVPDISVHGTLSKLEGVVDIQQYKLVRGFLSYNLGEDIDDLYVDDVYLNDSVLSLNILPEKKVDSFTWKNLSIKLDLQDVSVRLEITEPIDNVINTISLACINFIKSTLIVDSFSDGSQDIDLVSQEISVIDTRTSNALTASSSSQANVFLNILQPINVQAGESNDIVQAEVHSRKRKDYTKFTILLNNMRVMAILDWLESVRDFLAQNEEPPKDVIMVMMSKPMTQAIKSNSIDNVSNNANDVPIELKLNITDSQLVFVENTAQLHSNAVILKSTTIVSYRPAELNKLMSINLNHLEVFSCILGSEEDTALSIIDPVTVNLDIKRGVLDIQMQKQLCIRLSYHDVKMFQQMLLSLPKQTRKARSFSVPAAHVATDNQYAVNKLLSLGFLKSDCLQALEISDGQLDDAALWLTQNAEPLKLGAGVLRKQLNSNAANSGSKNLFEIYAVELKAPCISICVIDDCKDADVPLLELSLSKLDLRQELNVNSDMKLRNLNTGDENNLFQASNNFRSGHLKGVFASDYYNRIQSGWEPLIESWKLEATWNYSLGDRVSNQLNRLQLKINSDDLLKLNVTSTILELYELVRDNWTQDFYSNTNLTKTGGYRLRTPFIPFALKNDTGVKLWFTTIITSAGGVSRFNDNDIWQVVEPEQIVQFTFGQTKNKQRHHDTHNLNLHQISVRVDGWNEVGPISVDRVGIFFRHARYEVNDQHIPRARIVFAVTQEGSAQKLITVRSALKFMNKLDNPILVKMEHLFGHLNIRNWPESKTQLVGPNDLYSVPLSHVHSFLFIKPILHSAVNTLDTKQLEYEQLAQSHALVTRQLDASKLSQLKLNGSEYWNKYETKKATGSTTNNFLFTEKSLHWKDCLEYGEIQQELRSCRSTFRLDTSYKFVCSIRKEGYPSKDIGLLPGHSIMIWPPLRLHNLLPCDLLYKLPSDVKGRIASSKTANIHEIDLENVIEISVTLDGYPGAGKITVPINILGLIETVLKLYDVNNRPLLLKASIYIQKGCGVQITISAPFWLVNRTGLPLVFRQEGVTHECAGQYSENEEARSITPFMFSFSDPDASPALIVRLGKRYGANPNWCQPFNLHKDILHRQLKSACSNETFIIGIEVRRGRGRYSQTSVVTFSPRFQLYNRSSYKLQLAQKCFALTLTDQTAKATFMEAVPGCHLPFHWPRLDKAQELCVRLPDVADCLWSGGIPIYETQSLYINIRNINGAMHFLRLEIVLQGATYFLLFGDAEVLPPPIRIDNYSEVPMKFFQPGCKNEHKTLVRAQSSLAYVLDEPSAMHTIQIEAPGGDSYRCSLHGFEDVRLSYENFIYIAFTHTFEHIAAYPNDTAAEFDVKSQQLVLGVVDNRVILTRKQPGDRSQLWRMNHEKQLEHEGSSPPTEPGKKYPRFVLDLEKPPQPTQYINLVVRPTNKQRKSTQTWHFTEDGRLMCEHSNTCVQARGGFYGLQTGSDAVLGMIVSDTKVVNKLGVPFEQAIERQKLRPGSGCLSVVFRMDGPIKILQIKDVKKSTNKPLAIDPAWRHVSHILTHSYSANNFNAASDPEGSSSKATPTNENVYAIAKPKLKSIEEYHVKLMLTKGIGISLVSRRPAEELCFINLENITMEIIATPSVRSLDLSVSDMQIDNQLLETPVPIMLYTIKPPVSNETSPSKSKLSALQLNVKMLPSPNTNAVIVEHLILSLRPLSLYIEERLVLRLAIFFGLGKLQPDPAALPDESDYEVQRVVTKVLAANAKRYYFGDLQIIPSQIRLSVITASKLSLDLSNIKKSLGLTLIKFEDALINFEKFTDKHHFEIMDAYLNAIKSHYKQELKWQAASILGSVDFLGNPMGLANDLSEGMSGLFLEGSLTSLVKNVTHGLSNSTAKLTETLSDGLGRVVLDDQYTEARQKILEVSGNGGSTTSDHLVAGLKGLGYGLLGGVTSIVKHTYVGAQNDGLQGFISGLGRGIVGTVTKPVIGVLDLASETANAVRETSKSSNRILPERKRLPRCISGAPGGLLPPFSTLQSKGQQHLFLINKRDFNEQLLAYEPFLNDGKDSKLRLLVSSENVRIFSRAEDTTTVMLSYHLSEIISCKPVTVNNDSSKTKTKHYIELCLSTPSKSSLTPSGPEVVKRPRVRCQNEDIAQKASRHINYAKGIYDEREMTLIFDTAVIDH